MSETSPLEASMPRVPDAEPRLSFLMTAYQTKGYHAQMTDSVVAQTAGEWELVVVDNGRADPIADIVRSYAHDAPVHLVPPQDNKGYRGGVMAAAGRGHTNRLVTW